jgi:TonB family protein
VNDVATVPVVADAERALARQFRPRPSSTLRLAIAASFTAHAAVAMALVLDWPRRLREPHEVDAQIQMIFGHNATANGAAAQAAGTVSAAPRPEPARRPAPALTPDPSGTVLHAGAASGGMTGAPSPPVRLGDGMVGFEVPQPDAGIVEAQGDPGNRPPPYPDSAYRRHEHGSVMLRIHVGTDGRVASIETLQSSGYPDLDDAARDAAIRWRFIPQLRDGEPRPSYRDQKFDFVLD